MEQHHSFQPGTLIAEGGFDMCAKILRESERLPTPTHYIPEICKYAQIKDGVISTFAQGWKAYRFLGPVHNNRFKLIDLSILSKELKNYRG